MVCCLVWACKLANGKAKAASKAALRQNLESVCIANDLTQLCSVHVAWNVLAPNVCHWFFMEQQLRCLHTPFGVEPSLHNVVVHEIRQCKQAHSLVVRHPATY